jgi:hypothetical protein
MTCDSRGWAHIYFIFWWENIKKRREKFLWIHYVKHNILKRWKKLTQSSVQLSTVPLPRDTNSLLSQYGERMAHRWRIHKCILSIVVLSHGHIISLLLLLCREKKLRWPSSVLSRSFTIALNKVKRSTQKRVIDFHSSRQGKARQIV